MSNFYNIFASFYMSVSGRLKLAVLNIAVISTIIVFDRLFIFHLYVANNNK